jgi:hypothetical protein
MWSPDNCVRKSLSSRANTRLSEKSSTSAGRAYAAATKTGKPFLTNSVAISAVALMVQGFEFVAAIPAAPEMMNFIISLVL